MKKSTYFGGKGGDGHYQQIINLIPPHSTYIELFGGQCAIFRHKRPARTNIIFERDAALIPYYESIGLERLYDLEQVEYHLYKHTPIAAFYVVDSLHLIEQNMSMLEEPDTFIYADPPYPLDSRKSPTSQYRYELTDHDHYVLLCDLRTISAKIALSTYPNEIYDDFFLGREEWDFCEIEANTRHGRVTEQLWTNYRTPLEELHDYRYLGANYREREDITRQQRRWLAKYTKLPILEQRAMLELLTAATPKTTEELTLARRKETGHVFSS